MRRPETRSYCLCFFVTAFPLGALGPCLPIIAKSLAIEIEAIGIAFFIFFSGYLLGALISGTLIQRIPGHRLLTLGLLVLMVTFLVAPQATSLLGLSFVWGLLGICVGSLQTTLNTLLMWVHKNKVAPHMNAAHFSFGVGALLTPLLIIQSMRLTGTIDWAYWFGAVVAGLMLIRLSCLPSPNIPSVLPHTKTSKNVYPHVSGMLILFFLYVGAETSFAGWIPAYAINEGIADITTAAYFSSLFWAALTLGRLLWIPFLKHIAPNTVIIASIIGCTGSAIVVYSFGKTITSLGIGVITMGLSMSSIFPSSFSFLQQRIHMTGRINSLCLVAAALGGMIFPWLIGYSL